MHEARSCPGCFKSLRYKFQKELEVAARTQFSFSKTRQITRIVIWSITRPFAETQTVCKYSLSNLASQMYWTFCLTPLPSHACSAGLYLVLCHWRLTFPGWGRLAFSLLVEFRQGRHQQEIRWENRMSEYPSLQLPSCQATVCIGRIPSPKAIAHVRQCS